MSLRSLATNQLNHHGLISIYISVQYLRYLCEVLTRQHGEGNGNPLQYSCLENPRDRGSCWAAVSGVAQSRTRLTRFTAAAAVTRQHRALLGKRTRHCGMFTAKISVSF